VTYTGNWNTYVSSSTPVAAASTSYTPVAAASTSSSWNGVAAYTGGSNPVAPATFTGAASLNKVEFGVIALMGLAAVL